MDNHVYYHWHEDLKSWVESDGGCIIKQPAHPLDGWTLIVTETKKEHKFGTFNLMLEYHRHLWPQLTICFE